ncbi:MAG: hypothetical protein JO284_01520, partial [Planctomycetaceae bacterium]|nr:hypothetical protein [Planctomycetaceae bacterium]
MSNPKRELIIVGVIDVGYVNEKAPRSRRMPLLVVGSVALDTVETPHGVVK